jgi:hypothetical protein
MGYYVLYTIHFLLRLFLVLFVTILVYAIHEDLLYNVFLHHIQLHIGY